MEDTQRKTLLFSIVFLPTIFYLLFLRLSKQLRNLPPGPYPWPITGNLFQLSRTKLHVDLTNIARSHAPLFSIKLGTQLVVIASSPFTAVEILKTHDRLLSSRHVPHTVRIKNYIDSSLAWAVHCDERWKRLRTFCKTELFATKTLNSQSQLRQKKVSEMVNFLLRKEGELVKIGEVIFGTVFNVLGNSIFSQDVFSIEGDKDGMASSMKSLISRAIELTMVPNLADLYSVLSGFDIQGLNREAAMIVDRIYSLWDGFIRERREMGPDGDSNSDFLEVLISAGFSDLQIKALLLDMFSAGTDTSTSTVEWTMSELLKNPEAMTRAKEEIQRVIGERREGESAVEETHLTHLTYVQACIKETLRLHPPVPLLLPRHATQDCKVMNYTIPKDCRIMVNVWAIGRDPDTWENPSTFSPERFLNSSLDYKGNDFEFTPFGAGRRICPGLPFATCIVQLIVASLIYHLDWSLPHGMKPNELNMDEKFGLTLKREQPLLLIPKSIA